MTSEYAIAIIFLYMCTIYFVCVCVFMDIHLYMDINYLKLLEDFIEEFFYQNPISQLGVIITRNKRAEKISDLAGNSKKHIKVIFVSLLHILNILHHIIP